MEDGGKGEGVEEEGILIGEWFKLRKSDYKREKRKGIKMGEG